MKRLAWKLIREVAIGALLSTLLAGLSHAAPVPSPEVVKGLTWLQAQVQTAGTLTNEAVSIATPLQNRAETLQTLQLLGAVPSALADQLAADTEDNTEYLARRAVTLNMAGRDVSAITAQLLARQNGDGGFGGAMGSESNALDTAWTMLAMAQNTLTNTPAAQMARNFLQAAIQPDGGVGAGSDSARVSANAVALLALQMSPQDLNTATALKQITTWLLLKQKVDGSWLGNSYLTALSLSAVSPLVSDPAIRTAARTYLTSLQGADGSWDGDPFLTAVVLRALAFQPGVVPALTSSITGQVIDKNTATALAGATVTLSGASTATVITAIDGRLSFSNLAAGSYTLQVTKAGYTPYTNSYQLIAGQALDAGAIVLAQLQTVGIARGQIISAATGLPMSGVTVLLNGGVASAVTDANGYYAFTSVTPGVVSLSVSASGYTTVSGSGNMLAGQTLIFSPALYATSATAPTTGHFIGKVVEAGGGGPLAGVGIQLNGATMGVTAADGSFDLTLPPASYSAVFTLAGYDTASAGFLLTAGAVMNAGTVALSKQLTSTTISGVVKDQASGMPIDGAQVQILNGALATTGLDGTYAFTGLSGTSLDLRVSATGYVTQSLNLQISRPSNIVQDFSLQVQTGLGISLGALQVNPVSVGSRTDISVGTIVSNAVTGTPATVVLNLQVVNAQGQVIATAGTYDNTGANLLGQIPVNPGQQVPVLFKWNTGQFPAGTYSLVANVVVAGTISRSTPLGQVLVASQGTLTITPDQHFSGSVTADPPVLQINTNTPVHLSAVLVNDGNTDLPVQTYQMQITNVATGAVVATQQVNGTAFSPFALQSLTFADWTPAAGGGNFRIDVQAVASQSLGDVIGKVYVGDAATATFTVNKLAVPPGTQPVTGNIHVVGQDATQGTISDPLAPLIKTAIQKAVTYNDATASNWIVANGCSGCHVGAQALVGGEMNLKIVPNYKTAQRNIIFNKLANSQNANGSITPSYYTSSYLQAQTYLSLWALNSWHAKQDILSVLLNGAKYVVSQQLGNGSWYTDHVSGWWYSYAANTGLNTKSLVDIAMLVKQTPASALPKIYSLAPLVTGTQVPGNYKGAAADAAGNLYVTSYTAGTLTLVKPDGTTQTLLTGLSGPRPPAFGSDGALYIPSDGGVIRYTLAGQKTVLTTTGATNVALGPDGNIYAAAYWTSKIIMITPAGVVSDYVVGSPLYLPHGIGFDQTGGMVVADPGYGRVVRFNPDKSYSVVAYPNGAPYTILQDGANVLVGTSSGLVRYNSSWQGTTLTQTQAWSLARAADGRVLIGSTTVNPDTLAVLNVGTMSSTAWDGSISNAVNWLLVDSNVDSTDNIQQAFRLIGLGSANQYYAGTPLASTIQAKMATVGALLKSHQNTDGGWGQRINYGSDSMVTAQVGMALDYLNPSPKDPVVQNAIKLLLKRQQADGSWISENGVLSTHMAATTWVAIWLPIALDRIGGIDTDMTVSMPSNISLSNPSLAPTSSTPNAAGGMDYLWKLQGVTSTGMDVNFDLSMSNMVLGETRPVASNAYLTFNNTFTQQPVNAHIAIPRVAASDFLNLGVTTDQVSYPANTPVNIATVVNNTSATNMMDGSVKLEIFGADNVLTAGVGTLPFTGLAAGAQVPLSATWNTGTVAAGGYYVLATLYDAQNRLVGTARSVFNINPSNGGGTPPVSTGVGAAVTLDKLTYLPFDTVKVAGRISNLTQNLVQTGLQAVITIYRPDGTVLWTQAGALQQLLAGTFIDLGYGPQLSAAPAGKYGVVLTVQNTSAVELARSESFFTVLSSADTGSGLKGVISALPKIVPQTDPVILNWTVNNLGNADFAALPVTISIVDPATQQVMTQQAYTAGVARGQSFQTAFTWDTDPATVGSTYVALLAVTVNGKEIVLAQDNFLVTDPPVRLDVTQNSVRESRVLVWLACDSGEDQAAAGNGDPAKSASDKTSGDKSASGKEHPQPVVPPCIQTRTAFLQSLFTSLNVPYLITANQDDFRKAFLEGRYNVYWLSGKVNLGEQDATQKDAAHKDQSHKDKSRKATDHKESDNVALFKEIREAVYRGDSLILDGAKPDKPLLEAAGITISGQFSKSNLLLNTTGPLFTAQTLPTQGTAQKILVTTGISQAAFVPPANGDDSQSNNGQRNDGQGNDGQGNDGQGNNAQANDGQGNNGQGNNGQTNNAQGNNDKSSGQQSSDHQSSDGKNNGQQSNDHPANDGHDPAPVWPAIISNDYGRGHALAFGFDLVDTLQNSAVPASWSTLLQTGLTSLLPPLPDTYSAGAYVELNTGIQNQARAVDLAVATQLPTGSTLLQTIPNATLDTNGQPSWLFTLPEAATQSLQLSMRLPLLTGTHEALTTIDSIRHDKSRRYGEYAFYWTVAASDIVGGKLVTDLQAMVLSADEEREARDEAVAHLQQATTLIAQAQYSDALKALLEAVDKLRKISSIDITGYRLSLDSMLQETAWNWLRTASLLPDEQP